MAIANGSSTAKTKFIPALLSKASGTHGYAEIQMAPASVVRCFGNGFGGDGFKVSRQWVFRKGDLVFTLYDWKSTSLYDPDYRSPDELWQSGWPFDLHVGSKEPATETDVAEFIAFLQRETSAEEPASPSRALLAAWCECEHGLPDPIYMPDNVCPCGVDKHHYHCLSCRRISRVG
jgi:hypothetical protein